MASGIADDLLTCILFATRAPVLVVPAMNCGMYEHRVTQENIRRLKSHGVEFIGPIHGRMACRETGMGHIADNGTVLSAVRRRLKKPPPGRGKQHGQRRG